MKGKADHGGHRIAGQLNRFRKSSAELIGDAIKAPAAAAGAALRSLGIKPHDQVRVNNVGVSECDTMVAVTTLCSRFYTDPLFSSSVAVTNTGLASAAAVCGAISSIRLLVLMRMGTNPCGLKFDLPSANYKRAQLRCRS